MASPPLASPSPRTLPQCLEAAAESHGDAVAIRHKVRGIWRPRTWRRLVAEVKWVAGTLEARGFQRGDAIVVAGCIRPEAIVATLAAQWLGGAAIWIEPLDRGKWVPPQTQTGAPPRVRAAFAHDEAGLVALRTAPAIGASLALGLHPSKRGPLPGLDPALLAYDDLVPASLAEPAGVSPSAAPDEPALFAEEKDVERGSSDARAPGPPSPSLRPLTHKELIASARAWCKDERIDDHYDAFIWEQSPPAQIRGVLAAWLVAGFCLNCPEHASTAHFDRRELGPTLLVGSSDAYAALHRDVVESLPPSGTFSRWFVDWGLAEKESAWTAIVAEWLVRWPLRGALGLSRVKTALVLGAAPDVPVTDFFARLGAPLRSVLIERRDDRIGPTSGGDVVYTALEGLASILEPTPDLVTSPRGGAS
jgi:hypothetical protein